MYYFSFIFRDSQEDMKKNDFRRIAKGLKIKANLMIKDGVSQQGFAGTLGFNRKARGS